MHDHFQKHFHLQKKERTKIIRKGILFVVIGIIFMFFATYILAKYDNINFYLAFLLVVLEPAGWFFAWEGANIILFTSKACTLDYDFYMKMSKCEVKFDSY